MKSVFVDTHFFIAFLSERDADHQRAVRWLEFNGAVPMVTTSFILVELADGLSDDRTRSLCAAFVEDLRSSGSVRITAASDSLVWRGLDLYRRRPDKEWSLTDCISFVVMADENLAEALTADHHFEQAGFAALFAKPS